jgi:hypothetical protein
LARLPGRTLEEIEASPARVWLPFAYQMALTREVHALHGEQALIDLTEQTMREALVHPLYRMLRKGFIDLFGASPGTVLAALPRGMRSAGRHMGRLEMDVDAQAGTARTRWRGLPESMREPHVVVGHQGSYTGVLAWVGATQIKVAANLDRLDAGEASFELSWSN